MLHLCDIGEDREAIEKMGSGKGDNFSAQNQLRDREGYQYRRKRKEERVGRNGKE